MECDASLRWLMFIPIKIRPDIRAFFAARLTGKQRLKVRQLDIIRPLIRADRCIVTALIVGAIDQDTANA